jgi:hypothetical protein
MAVVLSSDGNPSLPGLRLSPRVPVIAGEGTIPLWRRLIQSYWELKSRHAVLF